MSAIDEHQKKVEENLELIQLCSLAVDKITNDLADPIFPDDKADLLLAIEELTEQTIDLLHVIRQMVWDPVTK